MAKRRGRPPRRVNPAAQLDPKVVSEVSAILLALLAVVILLSVIGQAGTAGTVIDQLIRTLFGEAAYLIPLVTIALAASVWKPDAMPLRGTRLLGLVLLLVALPTILHLSAADEFGYTLARAGRLGGLTGYIVSTELRLLLGSIAAWVVSIAGLLIGFLLLFRVSLRTLIGQLPWMNLRIKSESGDEVTVNQPKVSVFQTIKRSLVQPKEAPPAEEPQVIAPKSRLSADWRFPPLELLEESHQVASSGNITKNVETIQKTLKHFNIEVAMQDVNIGPTVTQYTLKPHEGVKLNQITARARDLELALSAKSLRIEAPIPGKGVVGIEIPNKIPARVTLREVLIAPEFKQQKSKLALALGRDVAGTPFVVDLEKMPHLMIAGATGSGKSVCINALLLNLLFRNSPDELRLLMVDPKRVELVNYNGLPHLLTSVITDSQKTVNALKWTVAEMERRYQLFSDLGKRNIAAHNEKPGPEGPLPYIVVVVDELADLMAVASADVEASIVRLAQLARATGIHLIVATQRPSVDVLTGLIKANITSRIAFAVASQIDSRTILDMAGAEKLLGDGDMLYISSDTPKPKRVQGVFPSDKEINTVIGVIKEENEPALYNESILEYRAASTAATLQGESEDPLFDDAVEVILNAGKASASLLQRRLKVGYARAARLLDLLEEANIIGPGEGAKPRDVLITRHDRPPRGMSHQAIPGNRAFPPFDSAHPSTTGSGSSGGKPANPSTSLGVNHIPVVGEVEEESIEEPPDESNPF